MENLSGSVIKGYELHQRIGAGGFGAVYKAHQGTVGRDVAIKIILPHFANHPDFIRRFETEAQLVARLEHLHIVPLYDYWRDTDGAYLVMRWLKGGSLREALHTNPFDIETSALVLDQLASALAAAHRNNVIHRDLKPGNILLDEDGNAYLADFGIAKDLTDSKSNTTGVDAIVGSPDYLSPEQARSEPVTPQTDIYSLGVVLYEMLTGQHPFPNLSQVERLYKHLSDPLPLIENLPAETQDSVNRVIQTATAKNPAHRYADVLAMAAAFHEAVRLHPIQNVVETLTPREQEILQQIIAGRSNKEIAQDLYITVMTVKWYITQIYRKLNVRSRVQAIVRARELNLIVNNPGLAGAPSLTGLTAIPTEQFHPENPYKGLRAFQAADNRDFFGREKLIDKLLKRMGEKGEMTRFLAVIGPSGSGKSSLVKAGLIPALWRGELPGSEKWFITEMLPGTHPLDELEIALTRVAATQSGNLREQLERDERGLLRAAQLILPDDSSEVVIVIDQFEEVFTLVQDESTRIQFLKLLHAAVTESRSRVRVVITLRADFYDRPLQHPDFGELVRSRMETVLPLSADGLERAITRPAEQVGVAFEPGLVASIVAEVNYQAGALPLLQYALTELFERRDGRTLTRSAYAEIGGAGGALAKRAEEVYQEFADDGKEAIRQMFLRLVTLGEGVSDTRRRVERRELFGVAADTDVMDEVIDTFAAYRLLSLDNDPGTRTPTVEVAHEAILKEWERLREWINDGRDDIRMQQQLAHNAQEWLDANKDVSYLASGLRLGQFEKWGQATNQALTPHERAYLAASLEERARQLKSETERQQREVRLEWRSQTFLRGLVGVLLLATIIAVTLAGIAQRNEASAERNAVISQSLALASAARAASSDGNGEQAIALAVAANRIDNPPVLAQRILYEVGLAPGTQAVVNGGQGWRWLAEVSPDKRMLAVQEDSLRIAIWDMEKKDVLIRLDGSHPDTLADAAFTPDSQRILVGSWDDALEMWDIHTGKMIWHALNPAGDPNGVAISPDGSLALVGSETGVGTLWDTQSGEYKGELVGHQPEVQVLRVAFSPDGRWAATASEDHTAIIWNMETREPAQHLEGHNDIVFAVSFSPDSRSLATTSLDHSIILWDVETGMLLRRLEGHTDYVFDVAWSPDGSRLLSASRDSTLILWDTADGKPLATYRDEAGRTLTVSFIDDKHAVSGGSSTNVRFWSLYDAREQRRISLPDTQIYSMAISPDEQAAVVGIQDAITLLDLQTGDPIQRFSYAGGAPTALAWSPDGKKLLAGYEDSSTILWDVGTGEEIRLLEGHTLTVYNAEVKIGKVLDVAFSPDGKQALSTAEDRALIVWDTTTGAVVHKMESCSDTINGAVFSPDGHYIAGGLGTLSDPTRGTCPEFDYSIRLWDTETGSLVRQFQGHEDAVVDVQFSPDGRQLISGSLDETVRLWDVETGAELRRFVGHTGGVTAVNFSPDGREIVSGASDGMVRVWDIETSGLLRQMVGHTGQVNAVKFTGSTQSIWSSSDDGSLRLWLPMLNLQDMLSWVSENRYVRELTCSEKQLYLLADMCS